MKTFCCAVALFAGLTGVAKAATLSSVSLSPSSSTVAVGGSITITCTNTYSDNSTTTGCGTIVSGGAGDSVSVSAQYGSTIILTGLSPVSSTVFGANYNGGQATFYFTVTPAPAEYLGSMTAGSVSTGLGVQLTTTNQWEWQQAAAMHVTHGRIQCSWVSTENPSTPGSYSLQPDCATAFGYAKTYGIAPIIVAAYQPPANTIATATLTAAAAAGATTLSITGSNVSSIQVGDFVGRTVNSSNLLSGQTSYDGTYISAVSVTDATHVTLTLAAELCKVADDNQYANCAADVNLASGLGLTVQRMIYAPPMTASATNPSNIAYAHYVGYLASQCVAYGITCNIELWNEPPWGDESWDNGGDYFDNYGASGATIGPGSANRGLAAAVQNLPAYANVSYIWAGTNKSGSNTLLGGNMASATGVALAQPYTTVAFESQHPYGNNPEDGFWIQPCLVALTNVNNYGECNFFGAGSNAPEGPAFSEAAQHANGSTYGLGLTITETGLQHSYLESTFDEPHRTRLMLRQYLEGHAEGMAFVNFYRMYDGGGGFGLTNSSSQAYPVVASLTALMADMSSCGAGTGSSAVSPVSSYTGMSYPLDSARILGTNCEIDTVWQRSYTTGTWGTLASPSAASVTLNVPSGMYLQKLVNTNTLAAVPYTQTGSQITMANAVSDDPIEAYYSTTAPASTTTPIVNGLFNGIVNFVKLEQMKGNIKLLDCLLEQFSKNDPLLVQAVLKEMQAKDPALLALVSGEIAKLQHEPVALWGGC